MAIQQRMYGQRTAQRRSPQPVNESKHRRVRVTAGLTRATAPTLRVIAAEVCQSFSKRCCVITQLRITCTLRRVRSKHCISAAAIMSWIIGVTLLLIILADSTAFSDGSCVTKEHIGKCRVFPNGVMKCRSPLLPRNRGEKMDLIKCLSSKANQRKFPEFEAICTSWHPGLPITLV
ncbi:hypothetical protein F2P81_009567 [Scophthalmus maximus]|uniref:Uncharacterized protein n=1 Tax=Scophthalmus maximus TaxID=52904 RepID=A0A6A4SZ36_SCOMX|nr:hypothetical protein F2P81_009567 [Scophthalmus maximus]